MRLAYFLVCASGCAQQEQIQSYRVPKPERVYEANRVAPQKDRMLAAIIPHEPNAWFFKVVGPDEAVRGIADSFRELIKSVRFSGDQGMPPTWSLPPGWRQTLGTGIRHATIVIETEEEPIELTVTSLSIQGNLGKYVLSNINRWRGQMQLSPISADQLSDQSEQIELGVERATMVSLVGSMSTGERSRPPFASGAPFGVAPPRDSVFVSYDKPPSWKPSKLESARGGITVRYRAAFHVEEGSKRVEITVIDMPGMAGGALTNVNRWRGQVGLGPIAQSELDEQTQHIPVDDVRGQYIEIIGQEEADRHESILAVIIKYEGTAWFFKLMGDAVLVDREKERFESFVKSVKFSS